MISGTNATLVQPTFGTQGVASPSTNPGNRNRGGLVISSSQRKLWLFGGFSHSGTHLGEVPLICQSSRVLDAVNSLFSFDITSQQWTFESGSTTSNVAAMYGQRGVAAAGVCPGARVFPGVALDDVAQKIYMFGGQDDTGNFYNDLFEYNIAPRLWRWISGSNLPNAAAGVSYGTFNLPVSFSFVLQSQVL